MFREFLGFTSTQGSTSLSGKFLPGWAATLSAVQCVNGLVPTPEPDTSVSGSAVNGPAYAVTRPMAPTAKIAEMIRNRRMTHLLLDMREATPVSAARL
ncbi:MAG: hypothetical protein AUG00_04075 [Candidatus Rokubacteria bacterium 13_1_20CM_2_70_7]|nr:MAG: hypothetical protein AUG00_04075 [Candidatus Rokubacteria bacterium 13_1_20CM_2_70_7]